MSSSSPVSLRDWIRQEAEEHDVDPASLLLQSKRRDPMWKGTDADHAKADWFRKLWELAVADRDQRAIHVRGVHYTIVMQDLDVEPPTRCSWDTYENSTECYDYLKNASVVARILGYVPLNGILDEKNDQTVLTEYEGARTAVTTDELPVIPTGMFVPDIPTVDERAGWTFGDSLGDYLGRRVASMLREEAVIVDRALLEPFHVELWCEKTLPEEVKQEARRHGVNIVVEGQGDLSYSVANALSQRIGDAGKPAVILYLSDFDPKGDNMAAAMAGKLSWLDKLEELPQRTVVKQLAVTREQIEEHGFPRKPIDSSGGTSGKKAYDTLVTEWEERKGTGAVELNVLETNLDLFREIVADGVRDLRDPELDDKIPEALDEWNDDVVDAVREAVSAADVGDGMDDVTDRFRELNDALEEVEDTLERLQDLAGADEIEDWPSTVEDLLDDVDVPEVSLPRGDADLPDGLLYDSERPYAENLRRVREHKNGYGAGGDRP